MVMEAATRIVVCKCLLSGSIAVECNLYCYQFMIDCISSGYSSIVRKIALELVFVNLQIPLSCKHFYDSFYQQALKCRFLIPAVLVTNPFNPNSNCNQLMDGTLQAKVLRIA